MGVIMQILSLLWTIFYCVVICRSDDGTRKVRRSTLANFSGEDLCDGGVRRRSAAPTNWLLIHTSPHLRVGGDLLLRRTTAHERWRRYGFSLTAPAIWLSLSLLRRTAADFSLTAPA
ncbi:hypothetical protein L6452_17385 [Arctium lappa]|uniref:Uncharacterized protein n=1 Tax=Arctium lappa TaxID=4217 RepID=A0ACB9C3B7_ARCLA|nr:hypothetical protein L6452_17385 [Arctium lappa]